MDFLEDKWVKTRKKHTCHGCAKLYESGTKMRYLTAVDQGDFSSWYTCQTCEDVLTISWDHIDLENGILFGEVKENDTSLWEKINVKYQ